MTHSVHIHIYKSMTYSHKRTYGNNSFTLLTHLHTRMTHLLLHIREKLIQWPSHIRVWLIHTRGHMHTRMTHLLIRIVHNANDNANARGWLIHMCGYVRLTHWLIDSCAYEDDSFTHSQDVQEDDSFTCLICLLLVLCDVTHSYVT